MNADHRAKALTAAPTAINAPTINTNTRQHPPPDNTRPTLRCRPDRVSGIPIILEILPFAEDTPNARLQENEKPNFLPILGTSLRPGGLTACPSRPL